ncbi:hypothetical protein BK645_30045 [Pseudomonas protegens]|nr:hypothetical protein BK645_30045 [Pseudomonas protegens]ROM32485.1 hypothetical protein BK646_26140 [Pseudomonas protegens]
MVTRCSPSLDMCISKWQKLFGFNPREVKKMGWGYKSSLSASPDLNLHLRDWPADRNELSC